MMPHSVNLKTKELFIVALLLNVAATGIFLFLYTEVKAKNERISALINNIEANVVEEEKHNSIKVVAAQTAEQRTRLQHYIVAKEEAVSFIELLEKTGESIGVGVDIASVREVEIAGSTAFARLSLALTATGAWPRVIQFLGLLELLPYEATITQVVVSKSEKQAGQWSLSLSLAALKEK